MRVLVVAQLLLVTGASRLRSSNDGFFNYNYAKHGEDWIAGTCASRTRQSPIDFPTAFMTAAPSGKFSYAYKGVPRPIELSNNGHTYSLDVTGMGFGGISFANAWFNLLSINLHAQSEHTFAGLPTPASMHLVHKRYDSDALVIIAIPFASAGMGVSLPTPYVPPATYEANFNSVLQYFLKLAPPPSLQKVTVPGDAVSPLDLNSLITGGTFFEYSGSLTAPPCAETVAWLVRREPLLASNNQIQFLKDAVFGMTSGFGNNRSPMPLMGREIYVRSAILDESADVTGSSDSAASGTSGAAGSAAAGQSLVTGRELRAMKWSKDALTVATSAVDYVRDLDFRIHTAAAAHATALVPPSEVSALPPPPLPPQPAPAPAPAVAPAAPSPCVETETAEERAERLAKAMSASIAQAANEAVTGAMKQITEQTRIAALNAANEATNAVMARAPVAAAR